MATKTKKITLGKVKEMLPNFDSYSVKGGVFTVRREFFYTHGVTAKHQVLSVKKHIPNAVIVDSGEVWKPFRGGATTANSSHWFVKFTVSE